MRLTKGRIILAAFVAAGALGALSALATGAQADSTWSGVYVGAHAGYADGNLTGTLTYDEGAGPLAIWDDASRKIGLDGWLAGAYAGYQRQIGVLVIGLEADIAGGDVDGDMTAFTAKKSVSWRIATELDTLGTVRARIGWVAMPSLMVYGTGGFAWARTSADLVVTHHQGKDGPRVTARGDASETHTGWTAGAGAEWQISQLRIRAEWLHVDLGDADYRLTGTNYITNPPSAHTTDSFPADLTFDVFRVGLTLPLGD